LTPVSALNYTLLEYYSELASRISNALMRTPWSESGDERAQCGYPIGSLNEKKGL
jgi:hypothetical protein